MKPILSKIKPRVAKMRKIINAAEKAKTLIHGELIGTVNVETEAETDSFTSPVCTRSGRCAMGELLFRAGYDDDELSNMATSGEWDVDVYRVLWDEYKIDNNDVETIIEANDAVRNNHGNNVNKALTKIAKRQKRVNPYLNRISERGEAMGPEPTKAELKVLEKFDVAHKIFDQYGGW